MIHDGRHKLIWYPGGQIVQLFDLQTDPGQTTPLDNPQKIAQMRQLIIENMVRLDAPAEAFNRFGFEMPKVATT